MTRSLYAISAMAMFIIPTIGQAAGFGINATRLIYPEGAASINVTLRNTDSSANYLVQSSVSRVVSQNESAPFDVIPPLFRMNSNSTHQARIIFRGGELPSNRESVFYYRAMAIPASAVGSNDDETARIKGQARFGVGKTIKLFYRPKGLSGNSMEAQQGLQFTRVGQSLKVTNPSPYYVSFASVSVGGKYLPLDKAEAKMLAPFGSHSWQANNPKGEVKWSTIGDHGGHNEFSKKLP